MAFVIHPPTAAASGLLRFTKVQPFGLSLWLSQFSSGLQAGSDMADRTTAQAFRHNPGTGIADGKEVASHQW
jgi:hypothetical protein